MSKTDSLRPTASTATGKPLAGLLVVALEQAVAAPYCSSRLADAGARVIKIERAEGDFARGYDRSVHGESSYFVWINRNKESVVLDLKTEQGIAALRGLVSQADVFIQNLAPGAVERLGLSSAQALELNPQLIYVSISGYGRGGEYEQKKAYDLLVQAETGLCSVTGNADAPARVGVSVCDIAAGMNAHAAILEALQSRFCRKIWHPGGQDGARATDYANGQFSVINFINAQINIAHGVGDPNDDG